MLENKKRVEDFMLSAIDDRQTRRNPTSRDFLDVEYLRNRLADAECIIKNYAEKRALMGQGDILPDVKEAYVEHLHKKINKEGVCANT